MFIKRIIKEIWKEHYRAVDELMKKYQHMNEDILCELAIEECDKLEITFFEQDNFVQNIIPSIGCTKCFKQYPCSFCNFHLEEVKFSALMRVLREKNTDMYVKILLYNFRKTRGGMKIKPKNVELFAVRDFFNEFEFPPEAFDAFLSEDGVFTSKPYYGSVFTGPGSINKEKIRKIKSAFRKNVTISIGIEVGNEWIRKYWLNKITTNSSIEKSISDINEEKATIGSTIILGMPGLSDRQSIELMLQTISWLNPTPIKYIQMGYLVKKKKTLQAFLFDELRNDMDLIKIGVVKGPRTGLMDIIVLFDSIMKIYENNESISKRIIFSPQNFTDNAKLYRNKDLYGPLTRIESELLDYVVEITGLGVKGVSKYKPIYEKVKETLEYKNSMAKLAQQHGLEDIENTMRVVGNKLSDKLFTGEERESVLEELEADLATINY